MEQTSKENIVMDTAEIQRILPHRYPFLMVDRVTEFEDNKRIVAIKNVTINEPFFPGHFPGQPVMPGVMMLEAMAQVAAILAHRSSDGVTPGKTVFLAAADNVRWKKPVLPGDTLVIEMIPIKKRRPYWVMEGTCKVDGKVVASAQFTAAEV